MGASLERFRLQELAARQADVLRVVEAAGFPRFAALCQCRAPIRIRLRFRLDGRRRVCLRGVLQTRLEVACHRCLAPVEADLHGEFSLLAVRSEAEASRLAAKHSVLLVDGDEVELADLVEDELILALPERPCADPACPKAPAMAWPDGVEAAADSPFQALGAWSAPADSG